MIKVLNLYSGIGGNRKLWPKGIKVTAVELDPIIAAMYKKLFPLDTVIVRRRARVFTKALSSL